MLIVGHREVDEVVAMVGVCETTVGSVAARGAYLRRHWRSTLEVVLNLNVLNIDAVFENWRHSHSAGAPATPPPNHDNLSSRNALSSQTTDAQQT